MKEGDNKTGMGLNELSTIRNILMGQQMAQYTDTFSTIHAKIDKADQDLNTKINQSNTDLNKKIDKTDEALNNKVDQSNTDLNAKIVQLTEAVNQRFEALEKDMNERFDRLEKLLLEKSETLDTKINTVSTNDKAALGQMLTAIGQKLIGSE